MLPLNSHIIVVQDGAPEVTKGGIHINIFGRNREHRPNRGTVEFAGPEVKYLKAGDKIAFTNYSGVYFINLNGDDRIIMEEKEVLFKYKEDSSLDIDTRFIDAQIYEKMKGVGADDYGN